jgi:tetratricopeptide (TPR) repeat protein
MSESTPTRKLTVQDLDRFLGLESESDEPFRGHLDAAAVLAAFDPFQLRPVGGAAAGPGPSLLDHLLPRCEPITQGPGRGLFSLLLPNRRVALRRLATREGMRRALRANPDRPNLPLQRMFERVVAGDQIALEDASREELAALYSLHDWVEGILEDLPSKAAIGRALARFDLLAPMRRLAGDDFVGRERELQQLHDYVFGPEHDQTQDLPPEPEPRSLFVFGPGGVGKSTLLARFILDKVESDDLPVVYLDIDRPTIRPDRPATLLLDAIAQLQPQLDVEPYTLDGLTKEISFSISRGDVEREYESFGPPAPDWQVEQFADTLGPLLDGALVLVVVDTFEEAQFLGSDVVWPLVQFLLNLGRLLPNLRLVLSGRALPEEYVTQAFPWLAPLPVTTAVDDAAALDRIPLPYRPINLGVLDEQSAQELVRRSAAQAGLPELGEEDLQDLIRVVSRNPMCLKLAVHLLRDESIDRLRASRSEFLTRLKAEKIQALLYGRILRHLHGDDVRAVAHPGLIVRRITPEVILEVLAEPCGLRLTPERNERTIFFELENEAALVQVDPEDGSLRHRVDVRRAMLEDLTDHVRPDVIEQIDRNAVRFYERWSDPISRAEEIYHRLRLREPAMTLDRRWLPEAAARLKGAGEELPARQRLWLATRLGITLDPSVRHAADQETWEDQAARSADRYLQARDPEEALEILHERAERLPRSRLHRLEAEAYRFLGRPDAALRVARAGVEAASSAGAIDLALELLLQMVVVEEGQNRIQPAADLLEEARAVAAHSANEVLRFRVTVTGLRLHRQLHPEASEERYRLRREAIDGLTDELMRAVRARPVLLREAAAELGKDDPRIAAAAIETLGVEAGTDAQAEALGHAITTLNDAEPSQVRLEPVFVDGAQQFQATGFDAKVIRRWATREVDSKDTRRLGATLAAAEPGSEVLGRFRNYFRAGVESSLRGPVSPSH